MIPWITRNLNNPVMPRRPSLYLVLEAIWCPFLSSLSNLFCSLSTLVARKVELVLLDLVTFFKVGCIHVSGKYWLNAISILFYWNESTIARLDVSPLCIPVLARLWETIKPERASCRGSIDCTEGIKILYSSRWISRWYTIPYHSTHQASLWIYGQLQKWSTFQDHICTSRSPVYLGEPAAGYYALLILFAKRYRFHSPLSLSPSSNMVILSQGKAAAWALVEKHEISIGLTMASPNNIQCSVHVIWSAPLSIRGCLHKLLRKFRDILISAVCWFDTCRVRRHQMATLGNSQVNLSR